MNTPVIRSYVLRQGRVSNAQTRALETGFPRWGIEYQDAPFQPGELDRLFGRIAPRVMEIGFGMGETTIALAQANPTIDFLAIDVHGPGVGGLLRAIEAHSITNIRVMRHDAVEILTHRIADQSLDGLHVFFPDPWPKARHHKRRLIQPAFVQLAAQRLKPDGYFHLATDWQEYADQMLAVLNAEPLLVNGHTGFAPRPPSRPVTKFEQRGLRLGHPVRDLYFMKR